MSSYNISNTSVLRNYYGTYRSFTTTNNRKSADTNTLSYADSMALHRAADAISDYDFENNTSDKTYKELRAFVDAYNNTIDSTKDSTDSTAKKYYKKIQSLTEDYEGDLEDIGITITDSGYLKLSSSAITNIESSTFESVLGDDADYSTTLSKYAKYLAKHIDVSV